MLTPQVNSTQTSQASTTAQSGGSILIVKADTTAADSIVKAPKKDLYVLQPKDSTAVLAYKPGSRFSPTLSFLTPPSRGPEWRE